MKRFSNILVILFLALFYSGYSQVDMSSSEALKKYQDITAIMKQSFPEDEYKTYKRESFTEKQLQTYLSQHFQRLDLLPLIEGHHNFKLHSYLHSGNWFHTIGFPNESIKWYKLFFDYYNKHKQDLTAEEADELVEQIANAYSVQADNYAKIGQLDNAALEHRKGITFTENMDIISNPSALNNYGLFFYWNKKEFDSALIYFNKAYQITLNKFPNHTLLGSIRDNIADIYMNKQQPEKALPLYAKNFDLYRNVKNERSNVLDLPRLVSAGKQLITAQIKLNRINDAEKSFSKLKQIFNNPDFINKITGNIQLEFLNAEEDLYEAQKNYKNAFMVSKKRNFLSDSLHAISKIADNKWQEELNTISLDRVALNFKIDRIEKENKIKNQQSKLLIVSLTSSSVLILLLSLFLRRRQHIVNAKNKQLLAEQELEFTAIKNEQLQSEIESKKRDLSDFAINLTQNQEWAESLADKISEIKETHTKEQIKMLDDLEQAIKNKITFDTDTQLFYERLDKLSDAFYSKLTDLFPNLSKNEIRLCSLIRLKMDSRNIATLQNITVASLNTSRYRLRKKLNLTEEVDLDQFIQNI